MSYESHGEKVIKDCNYTEIHRTSVLHKYYSRYYCLLQMVECLEKELLRRDDYFVDEDGDVSFMSIDLEVKACKQIQRNKDVVEAFNVIKKYLEEQKNDCI